MSTPDPLATPVRLTQAYCGSPSRLSKRFRPRVLNSSSSSLRSDGGGGEGYGCSDSSFTSIESFAPARVCAETWPLGWSAPSQRWTEDYHVTKPDPGAGTEHPPGPPQTDEFAVPAPADNVQPRKRRKGSLSSQVSSASSSRATSAASSPSASAITRRGSSAGVALEPHGALRIAT